MQPPPFFLLKECYESCTCTLYLLGNYKIMQCVVPEISISTPWKVIENS